HRAAGRSRGRTGVSKHPHSRVELAMANKKMSRRSFMSDVAITGAGLTIVPRRVLGRGMTAPSDTLNIAVVGLGGRGRDNLVNVASENIVALCDVDWDYANRAFEGLAGTIGSRQARLDRPANETRLDAQGRPEPQLTPLDR